MRFSSVDETFSRQNTLTKCMCCGFPVDCMRWQTSSEGTDTDLGHLRSPVLLMYNLFGKWTLTLCTPFSINGSLLQKTWLRYVFGGICSGLVLPSSILFLSYVSQRFGAPSPREKENFGWSRINCAYPLPRTRVRSVRGGGELCGSRTTMDHGFPRKA